MTGGRATLTSSKLSAVGLLSGRLRKTIWRFIMSGPLLQFVDPRVGVEQLLLDAGNPIERLRDRVSALFVEIRRRRCGLEPGVLGLERLNARRQAAQLALLIVSKLASGRRGCLAIGEIANHRP